MSSPDISKEVNRSLAWVGAASSFVGVLDWIAHVVVLYWISPFDFGVAMLAVSLFPVLDLATDLGITAAVIQRDDHTRERVSTVFWLNVAMSLVLFATLAWGIGPLLDWIFEKPILIGLLTAYGFKLIWQNVYFIPYALMKRELRFKELSIIRVVANIAEFTAIIGVAAAGYGVWCFVAGPLSRVFVTGIGVQLRHPWRPLFVLHIRDAMDWAVFGVKTSAHKMLFHIYTNVDYHIVAYFFSETATGLYGLAYKIVLEPARVISEVVQNIAFPVFSKLKHDRDKLVEQLVVFVRLNLVVMLSFLGIVFVGAEPLIATFWPNQWIAAAPAAQILCGVALLRALSFVIPPLLDGMGRPTLTLIYTSIAAVVLPALFVVCALVLGDRFGYLSVAIAWTVGYPIAFAVLVAMALHVLQLRTIEFTRRIIGIPIVAGIAMIGAELVSRVCTDLPAVAQLSLISATMLIGFFALLARTEGINPRSIMRAVQGKKD